MGRLTKRGRPKKEAASEDGTPGRKRPKEAAKIAARLQKFLEKRYGTRYEASVAKDTGVPWGTVYRWTNVEEPITPETPTLIAIARGTGISLDWLLLGEGLPERGTLQPRPELADALRAQVVAAVATAERASSDEAKEALPPGSELLEAAVLAGRSDFARWRSLKRRVTHQALARAREMIRQQSASPTGSGGAPLRKALDWEVVQ